MLQTLKSIGHGLRALLRPRFELAIENAALRQQLAVLKQKRPRPSLSNSARLFWVTLRRFWTGWSSALIVVKPETVTRWHRQSFKYFWRWKSRKRGRPRTDREVRLLIQRMATENGWRAPRIHAELLKLGLTVSERTVSRYLPKHPVAPSAIEQWKIFLRNHRDVLAAMDFFTVPTGGHSDLGAQVPTWSSPCPSAPMSEHGKAPPHGAPRLVLVRWERQRNARQFFNAIKVHGLCAGESPVH